MELQEIEVTIGKNGQVVVKVKGVKGRACLDLTKDLEISLGNLLEERTMTSEAGEQPSQLPKPQTRVKAKE
jgi:hypothetical protein